LIGLQLPDGLRRGTIPASGFHPNRSQGFGTMRKAFLVFALLGLVASSAAAQEEGPRRSGFWLNVGFGWGSADQNCDNCGSTDRESGLSGQLALGATLSPQFLLGVESNGWYKEKNSVKSTLGSLVAVAYFYPSASGNLFLKGGVGLASYRFSNGSSIDDTGLGLLGGVGYDIPLGKKFSLTPVATYQYGSMGDANGAKGLKQNIISVGGTFTLH
jgi:hypothetical protein